MNTSVYLWSLRPEDGLSVELRITAENASVARRRVHQFLAEHDGVSWTVECVAREMSRTPRSFVVISQPQGKRLD